MNLNEKNKEAAEFILTMLDGKTIEDICDILDVVNYCISCAEDDEIFSVDKIFLVDKDIFLQ